MAGSDVMTRFPALFEAELEARSLSLDDADTRRGLALVFDARRNELARGARERAEFEDERRRKQRRA